MFFPNPTGIIQSRRVSRERKFDKSIINYDSRIRRGLSFKDEIKRRYPPRSEEDDSLLDWKRNIKRRKKPKSIEIVAGEKLKCGVRRFLSYNGETTHLVQFNKGFEQDELVGFDFLTGKYVLICCFDIPMHTHEPIAKECRALADAYHELSERGFPLVMVVVANMRTDVDYDLEAAFYHFYSAFSCLAIPFPDFQTRDYIRHSFDLDDSLSNSDSAIAILVDPQGIILLDNDLAFDHFLKYGSDWAPPFHPTTLDAINKQDEVLRSKFDPMYLAPEFLSKLHPIFSHYAIDDNDTVDEVRQQPLSLSRDILLCDPNLTLIRFDTHAAKTRAEVCSTVLELSRKYVGLYLLIDGDIMEDIKAAHDHCLANNQQLEIVVVPMPFHDEPLHYHKQLVEALESLKIKSWFLYSNCPTKVCRRLWRTFGRGCDLPGEKFIIIPPNCESGELCGREVITNFGVDQYPFTRTAILKQRLEYVRSLTPVFSSPLFNNCRMFQSGQEFYPEKLQGKNVLLYLSWTACDRYSLMRMHYPKIKAMGWEVVFALLDNADCCWNIQWADEEPRGKGWPCFNLDEMPWPYMRLSAAAGASIKKLFFPGADNNNVYLFAVGKDGNIVSRDVEYRLDADGVTKSLFDDVLEADLAYVLANMPLYDGDGYED